MVAAHSAPDILHACPLLPTPSTWVHLHMHAHMDTYSSLPHPPGFSYTCMRIWIPTPPYPIHLGSPTHACAYGYLLLPTPSTWVLLHMRCAYGCLLLPTPSTWIRPTPTSAVPIPTPQIHHPTCMPTPTHASAYPYLLLRVAPKRFCHTMSCHHPSLGALLMCHPWHRARSQAVGTTNLRRLDGQWCESPRISLAFGCQAVRCTLPLRDMYRLQCRQGGGLPPHPVIESQLPSAPAADVTLLRLAADRAALEPLMIALSAAACGLKTLSLTRSAVEVRHLCCWAERLPCNTPLELLDLTGQRLMSGAPAALLDAVCSAAPLAQPLHVCVCVHPRHAQLSTYMHYAYIHTCASSTCPIEHTSLILRTRL
jgi:hypothetical protein